jgi:acylphosphatase
VQGVGFRYTTARLAGRYRVSGYVKNLPDGAVELVAEGAPAELDGLLADIASAMSDYIQRSHVETSAATGRFSNFSIRH